MTALDTAHSVISHRGMSCLELHRQLGEQARELRQLRPRAEQATAMEARIDEQALTIGSLREQLGLAKQIRDDVHAKAGRYDEAEARTKAVEQRLAEQEAELVALRQFKANVNSVSSLPPTGPETPAADRFETGSPVRLGASPLAVTNPGHVPTGPDRSNDETQPIPVAKEAV
ncbi:hypothetical protein AB0D78_28520 [Streptomyces avermitilis]|uniref:hypothetical protein n=1 Tax=Streptomyces avermitilis TaxID=33903 RepID=UPI0033DE793E